MGSVDSGTRERERLREREREKEREREREKEAGGGVGWRGWVGGSERDIQWMVIEPIRSDKIHLIYRSPPNQY